MPLELCPDCENHCSTSAKTCPKCGYIFKRDSEFITQLRSKQKTLLEDGDLLSRFGISILYLFRVAWCACSLMLLFGFISGVYELTNRSGIATNASAIEDDTPAFVILSLIGSLVGGFLVFIFIDSVRRLKTCKYIEQLKNPPPFDEVPEEYKTLMENDDK